MFTEAGTSRYATAGSLRIHYNEAGVGEPLLFIHGGGPGATGWNNFESTLQNLSADFRCILIDLPLFGKSDKPESIDGPRLTYFARVVRDFLDDLGIEQVNLVGNSLGGGTAVRLAIDYPERIRKLVIMGGGGTVTVDPSNPQVLGEGLVALMQFIKEPSRESVDHMLRSFVYDLDLLPRDMVEERAKFAMQPEIIAAQRVLFHGGGAIEDLTPLLSRVAAETLVLWGREDQFVPLEAGIRFFENIDVCEMHTFSQCGHWVMIERPAQFESMVTEFVSRPVRTRSAV